MTTRRPVTLSTSLFDDLWANALDPAYTEAAVQRASAGGRPRTGGSGTLGTVLALVAAGTLTGSALAIASQRAPVAARAHAALAREIERRIADDDRLNAALDAELAAVSASRAAALRGTVAGADLASRIAGAEAQAAGTAVRGSGAVVTLTDGTATAPTGAAVEAARVSDRELQSVVNTLWSAGASAIAINGIRLGPRTAIRAAGLAVLVDFRPLLSPYAVAAIGDPVSLSAAFADSVVARQLETLRGVYGLGVDVRRATALHLPAAATAAVTAAQPLVTPSTSGRTP